MATCNINTLLSDGKAFQYLDAKAQQIIIAQLLCDISSSPGGDPGADALTVTVQALADPFVFVASRRTTVEVTYEMTTINSGDPPRVDIVRSGVGDVLVSTYGMVPVTHKGHSSLRLSPGDSITISSAAGTAGNSVSLTSITTYEE